MFRLLFQQSAKGLSIVINIFVENIETSAFETFNTLNCPAAQEGLSGERGPREKQQSKNKTGGGSQLCFLQGNRTEAVS